MSDLGDDFREQRHRRQDYRWTLVPCEWCGLKNVPGEPCINCQREEWIVWNKERKAKP